MTKTRAYPTAVEAGSPTTPTTGWRLCAYDLDALALSPHSAFRPFRRAKIAAAPATYHIGFAGRTSEGSCSAIAPQLSTRIEARVWRRVEAARSVTQSESGGTTRETHAAARARESRQLGGGRRWIARSRKLRRVFASTWPDRVLVSADARRGYGNRRSAIRIQRSPVGSRSCVLRRSLPTATSLGSRSR